MTHDNAKLQSNVGNIPLLQKLLHAKYITQILDLSSINWRGNRRVHCAKKCFRRPCRELTKDTLLHGYFIDCKTYYDRHDIFETYHWLFFFFNKPHWLNID